MTMSQRQRNILRIIEEIGSLEGTSGKGSSTKPEAEFKREPLLGYWHKHYTDAAFMPQNLLNEMRRDQTVARVLASHVGQTDNAHAIGELVKAVVQDNYLRQMEEGRVTGEWIIFAKTDGQNYYLTLAEHFEHKPDIAERIHRYAAIDQQMEWDSRRGGGIIFPKLEQY